MTPLKIDDVMRVLPALDELEPVLDLLRARSVPDPLQRWSASGELGTDAGRHVAAGALADGAAQLARARAEELRALYGLVADGLAALERSDVTGCGDAFLEAARLEETAGRAGRAAAWARAAWLVTRDAPDRSTAGRALRRWARAVRTTGDLEEARRLYREALDISLAIDDARGAAEARIGEGNVLEQQGRWDAAERIYREALSQLGESGPPAPERWHALLNLHIVLRSRGAVEESLPLLDAATDVAERIGDTSAASFLGNARGQLAAVQGRSADAEAQFRDAVAAAGHPAARVTIRLNLAEALLAQGRALDAAEEARHAEREALATGLAAKLPEVYRLLGRIAASRGHGDAFVLFEHALELIRERRLPALEEAHTLQAYAEAEQARGEEAAAAQLLETARALYRSVGIEALRQPWVDVYDGAPSAPLPERDEP
ncbi:MAG: tetratricopeptide repeat protein [Gemmatimonadota bacterium]